MSAMTAIANENPITKTFRASSRRVVIICSPLVNTKADVKNNDAPITGTGIAAKPIAATGNSEKSTNATPVAKPTLRLVMPIALDNPTEELLLLTPELPTNPENSEPKPLAAKPPASEVKLGRTQSMSLRRWALDTSPMVRSVVATATTANGASKVTSNLQPKLAILGSCRIDSPPSGTNVEKSTMPAKALATYPATIPINTQNNLL